MKIKSSNNFSTVTYQVTNSSNPNLISKYWGIIKGNVIIDHESTTCRSALRATGNKNRYDEWWGKNISSE